jgi:hypothetical protein
LSARCRSLSTIKLGAARPIHDAVTVNARQKRALGRELRDVVFRICSVAGLVFGALWASHHRYISPAAGHGGGCAAHHAPREALRGVGRCVGTELSNAVMAWVIPGGVGLLLGALVGAMLASVIRLGRRSSPLRARTRW